METRNFIWYWNFIHYSVYRFLVNQSFSRPTIHAGGIMGFLVMIIDWGIFNISQIFFTISLSDWAFKNNNTDLIFLAIQIIPAFIFNYFMLFRDNKYVDYFAEFDEMKSNEKNKSFWISSVSILFIIAFFIVSFKYVR